MSPEKLTIVVTCTDRKSMLPHASLLVRNLPSGEVGDRMGAWQQALRANAAKTSLESLYCGENWAQVKRLTEVAASVGYQPEVLVASAGLGLRSVRDEAPSYAATFSTGHADSVAGTIDDAQEWWRHLPHSVQQGGRKALWVLSETYSRVVAADLLDALPSDDLLVFGGSNDIPEDVRVPADRQLRRSLGGTVMSLNVRTAIQWLNLTSSCGAFGSDARAEWTSWSARERHSETYDRTSLDDAAVIKIIGKFRKHSPGISKTQALKSLRAAGIACEQRRFSTLFEQAVAHG